MKLNHAFYYTSRINSIWILFLNTYFKKRYHRRKLRKFLSSLGMGRAFRCDSNLELIKAKTDKLVYTSKKP